MSDEKKEEIQVFEARIREFLSKGILPIIDVEHHWSGNIPITELVTKMDRNGVALTWLGQQEKLGSKQSIKLHELYPDRIVPTTVHGSGTLWHGQDKSFLEQLITDVRSGKYFAMGEFEGRHYPSNTNERDVHMPVDSASFQEVFRLSEETGVPFLLHHEAEDEMLPELERMLEQYPGAKVIWCHVGRNRDPQTWIKFPPPDGVRAYLKKYPNLYFDLATLTEPQGRIDILYDISGTHVSLNPEWKELLEEFPDRFLIGSDVNSGRWEEYDSTFDTFRTAVLGNLGQDVAQKIAYKNAWKLMTGEDWRE
jgi:predicted TIM-barrel fold metal-dependent hydrolase